MSSTRKVRRAVAVLIASTGEFFTSDKRKMRRHHRWAARKLILGGTLLNGSAPVGSTPWLAAQWHLERARYLGR